MPGSILAVGTALEDVALVQASRESPPPIERPASQMFAVDYGSDNAPSAGYNAVVAESAATRQLAPADAAREARPAMDSILFPEITAADAPADTQPDQPLRNPLQLDDLANPFAGDYFGVASLAFGDTNSLAPTGGEGGGEGVGGGATPSSTMSS